MNNGQAAKVGKNVKDGKKTKDKQIAEYEKNAKEKWQLFKGKLESYLRWQKLSKDMIKNLDDQKQWAPLHYAVFNNNTFVCDKLTAKKAEDKHFQCGM